MYRAVFERILCLVAVGYVSLIVIGALTVFQRFCRICIILHSQSARTYRASAASCRERASTWTERSINAPDGPTRAEFARRAAWFASRAEEVKRPNWTATLRHLKIDPLHHATGPHCQVVEVAAEKRVPVDLRIARESVSGSRGIFGPHHLRKRPSNVAFPVVVILG